MRTREEVGRRPTERFLGCLIEVARDGEKALGSEEPAVRQLRQPARAKRGGEPATHGLDRARVIDRPVTLAAAGLVLADERGDAFEQRRFPAAVLADDDRDRFVEIEG